MSYVNAHQITRHFDISDPWIVRKIMGREKNVLTAVKAVSFAIPKGQTYALVGESGSGKSTIAQMVAGLLRPSSGTITINGHDFCDPHLSVQDRLAMRRWVQMVFQSPYASLNPRWKIRDILREPIVAFGLLEDRSAQDKRVVELLEPVGLSPKDGEKYPHEFSGGQRQRISIARAIASQPELIICDEPTSALDVSVQAQVLNLLKDLQRQFSLTYLFISHDLAVISTMANRIGVLQAGELVEEADASVLFTSPQHEYTKLLLDAAPNMKMEAPS